MSYATIQSSQDTPYYFNFGTGDSSWQLTEVLADSLSSEPVSFNDIKARNR